MICSFTNILLRTNYFAPKSKNPYKTYQTHFVLKNTPENTDKPETTSTEGDELCSLPQLGRHFLSCTESQTQRFELLGKWAWPRVSS